MAKKEQRRPRIWAQYRGKLTFKQIEEGSNVAIRNAVRLLGDANALFALGRYPSAAFLAAIAIEEYGKLPILDLMASAELPELKWKEYRSHLAKNARWILPVLADSGPRSIEEFVSAVNPDSGHQQLLDELKQLWLYTDCLEEGKWSDPCEHASRKTAEWLIGQAGRLISEKEAEEKDIANRASFFKMMDLATTREDKKYILAEYLRSEGKLSEDKIEALLNGKFDIQGAGKK